MSDLIRYGAPEFPLRLTGRYGASPVETDAFGDEIEEGDAYRMPSPVRTIAVTEAMRAADTRQQRERVAALAPRGWAIKAELRAENLVAARAGKLMKPQTPPPGRKANPVGREVVMRTGKPTVVRTPRPAEAPLRPGGGRTPKTKPCKWCGALIAGYIPRMQHERQCTLKTAVHGGSKSRVAKTCPGCGEVIVGWPAYRLHLKTCARFLGGACANGCGRPCGKGKLGRRDGLCGTCGNQRGRKEARAALRPTCGICGETLSRLARGLRCAKHPRRPTTLPNHSDEETQLNEGWKTRSLDEKRIAMECLVAHVQGALEASEA